MTGGTSRSRISPPSDEHVERFVQIEVKMTEEVTSNEVVDFLLGHSVLVLEIVVGFIPGDRIS